MSKVIQAKERFIKGPYHRIVTIELDITLELLRKIIQCIVQRKGLRITYKITGELEGSQ